MDETDCNPETNPGKAYAKFNLYRMACLCLDVLKGGVFDSRIFLEAEKEEAEKEVSKGIYKYAGLIASTAKFRARLRPTRPDDTHLN